jgi:uncharacterized protein (DUF1778 family)
MSMTTSTKTARLEARLTAEQKALFERAAGVTGRSVTDFVLDSAAEEARRVVREAHILELAGKDSAAFAAALLNPPEPNERLRSAALRHARSSPAAAGG